MDLVNFAKLLFSLEWDMYAVACCIDLQGIGGYFKKTAVYLLWCNVNAARVEGDMSVHKRSQELSLGSQDKRGRNCQDSTIYQYICLNALST